MRWLLSHQAGVPALREDIPPSKQLDWKFWTEALAAEAPWWEPGTQHGYHALSFGHLVGEVVRRADGRTLGRYFREELASRSGSTSTSAWPPSTTRAWPRSSLLRRLPRALPTRSLPPASTRAPWSGACSETRPSRQGTSTPARGAPPSFPR